MVQQHSFSQLEQDTLAELSGSNLMNYARMASQGVRLSGSVDEKQVFVQIEEQLKRMGFTVEIKLLQPTR